MHDGTVVIPAAPGWYVRYFANDGEPGEESYAHVIAWQLFLSDEGDFIGSTPLVVGEDWAADDPVSSVGTLGSLPGSGVPWVSREKP